MIIMERLRAITMSIGSKMSKIFHMLMILKRHSIHHRPRLRSSCQQFCFCRQGNVELQQQAQRWVTDDNFDDSDDSDDSLIQHWVDHTLMHVLHWIGITGCCADFLRCWVWFWLYWWIVCLFLRVFSLGLEFSMSVIN